MQIHKSFLSEHSTEFVLVPALSRILRQRFGTVIPLSLWMSREGGPFSKSIHQNDHFKVVALFAKRPKIDRESKTILIKVNEYFLDAAIAGEANGIPVICGSPLVTNIWELTENSKKVWIKLDNQTQTEYLYSFEHLKPCLTDAARKNIFKNEKSLLDFVDCNSAPINIEMLIKCCREIRVLSGRSIYWFFGGYKPVYFLLK